MIEAAKSLLLTWMKVPPEPRTPSGSTGSVTVFRASNRYLHLKLIRWGFSQFGTLMGLVAAFGFFFWGGSVDFPGFDRELIKGAVMNLIGWAEIIGFGLFVMQLPVSLLFVLLDWEMRWYIVTDRSLRIREGVWKVNELTMTFANIQEVSIRQGPIERVLGLSNLRVRTAGGGSSKSQDAHGEEKSGHIGYFRGVDNAAEIRDLILGHLKRLRDAGLGDPDQPLRAEAPVLRPPILDAAAELLGEARALRQAVERR